MQLIAESYDLLRNGAGLEVPRDRRASSASWNESELESFLIEITARVLAKTDDATGQPLVDVILDAAEQKGTGRWTAQNALELGVPLTGITEAVFARTLTRAESRARGGRRAAGRAEREHVGRRRSSRTTSSTRCTRRRSSPTPRASPQMAAAVDDEGWDIDLGSMATIWRGGCIIRARFLDRIREAYDRQPDLANLMMRRLLRRRAGGGPGPMAPRGRARRRAGDPDPGVLVVAGLLRRIPPRPRPGQPDPGSARPVRGPHLSPGRPRRHVPRAMG